MITYIKNEFIKIQSEKILLVIIILGLLPIIMNAANFLLNDANLSLTDGLYFRFYNQFFMLLPIISSVISASIFYIEYKNDTFINWMSYNSDIKSLFLSKFITSILISFFIFLMNLGIVLFIYIINSASIADIINIFISFFILNVFTILIMTFLSIFIINITKNIVATIVIGIGTSIISMIFMAAPFSYIFPTAFGYRLGLSIIDSQFYYEDQSLATLIGITITLLLCIILALFSYRSLKVKL